jgi:hypothetical protein
MRDWGTVNETPNCLTGPTEPLYQPLCTYVTLPYSSLELCITSHQLIITLSTLVNSRQFTKTSLPLIARHQLITRNQIVIVTNSSSLVINSSSRRQPSSSSTHRQLVINSSSTHHHSSSSTRHQLTSFIINSSSLIITHHRHQLIINRRRRQGAGPCNTASGSK